VSISLLFNILTSKLYDRWIALSKVNAFQQLTLSLIVFFIKKVTLLKVNTTKVKIFNFGLLFFDDYQDQF
jgi:hypothetical protein